MGVEAGLTLDAGLGFRHGGLTQGTGMCVNATVGHRWQSRLWLGARWSGCQTLDMDLAMDHRVEVAVGPDVGARFRARPQLVAGIWIRPDRPMTGTFGPAVDLAWQTGRWRIGGRVRAGVDVARTGGTWAARPAVGVDVVVGWGPSFRRPFMRDEPPIDVPPVVIVVPDPPPDGEEPGWGIRPVGGKCSIGAGSEGGIKLGLPFGGSIGGDGSWECEGDVELISPCEQQQSECETKEKMADAAERRRDLVCQTQCERATEDLDNALLELQGCLSKLSQLQEEGKCVLTPSDLNPLGR